MLFALALIPAAVLLVITYMMDKKEKEPIGLLIGLFFAGMGTCISALILELIGEGILGLIFDSETVIFQTISAFLVVALSEEAGKFVVLRLITWKNKNFDYNYDGIVYAVFVSLGFAALENVCYVVQDGLGTAIARMFTSVPGHTAFAVVMGYFYSKAKYAALTGDKKKYKRYHRLALIAPVLIHGLYDALLFDASASDSTAVQVLCILGWIAGIIALFVVSIIMVVKTSKNDFCIVMTEDKKQIVYRPVVLGTWVCSCGKSNDRNFCPDCGSARPVSTEWVCPTCGTVSCWKFCGNCGTPRSLEEKATV